LYDAILFASVRPQSGAKQMGDDVTSPNNWANIGVSPIAPTFHPWCSPISWAGIKGCVSTKIGSYISAAVLDSRNPRPYV